MVELISKRGENSKTFDLGGNKYRLEIGGAHAHYKDKYADAKEQWKEVDLTIVDGKITKAPYILEIDGDKYTVTDKKTGKVSVVEKLDKDTDFKLIPGTHTIRFQTTIKEEKDLKDLKYKISGDIPVVYSAYDADGEPLELGISKNKDTVTEKLKTNGREIKYPIKIDPTLTIQGSGKDTKIVKNAATTNYGSNTFFTISNHSTATNRSLVSMSISALPAGATISSALFSMYHYRTAYGGNPNTKIVTLTRVVREDWEEAQATWNIYKTSNNWGTAGCANTTTDIDTSLTATDTFTGTATGWMEFDVYDIVAYAYANSLTFNVIGTTDYTADFPEFYSKEYGTDTSLRPKLVIEYTEATPLPVFMNYYQNIMR